MSFQNIYQDSSSSIHLNKIEKFTTIIVPRVNPNHPIPTAQQHLQVMRVIVIGGSGQTGRLVIDEALKRGHKITALLRDTSALPAREGLNIVKGTPVEPSDIESAFNAVPGDPPTAVIVTLSSPREKGARVISHTHENLVAAMKRHAISKIATVSSFGVGSSFANINFMMKFAISSTPLKYPFIDHNDVDKILKKSDLKFVLLRPARLTMGKKAPVQFLGDDGKGLGVFAGMGGISRANVAACLVDAVEKDTWDRSTPVITN